LPHAQAWLDLNEICARQLAALKPGELPIPIPHQVVIPRIDEGLDRVGHI
jgi:hypothetical protein